MWGVNLHTVRRAYLELQNAGLVKVARPLGTFVAPGGCSPASSPVQDFVRTLVAEAEERFGMNPEDLARAIQGGGAVVPSNIHVVECSHTLSASLARQIGARWGGDVRPVHLDDLAKVGRGRVVGTYFHFNEIRAALSHRIQDLNFVSIAPDPDELERMMGKVRRLGATALTLCERDELMAQSVLADVTALLGKTSVALHLQVTDRPASLLRHAAPVLFSPGSWDLLTEEQRRLPQSFLLAYRVAEADLARHPLRNMRSA